MTQSELPHAQYHTLAGDHDTKQARDEEWAKDLVNGVAPMNRDWQTMATPDNLISEIIDHKEFEAALLKAIRFDCKLREIALECAHKLLDDTE